MASGALFKPRSLTSPTMPTTSHLCPGKNVSVKCFPSGSSFGHSRFAIATVISTAPGLVGAS